MTPPDRGSALSGECGRAGAAVRSVDGAGRGCGEGAADTLSRRDPGPHPGVDHQDPWADRHRPRYHLLPPSGWMNDPNGVVHWRGRYHVFYQHNPHAPRWGPPHWGHAVSDDLVRWQHLPVALTPDMPPVDPDGCWSGCLVDDDGTPTILYTGVRDGEQTTCLATGSTDLLRWRKHPANPVARVPGTLATHALEAHRDPFVWREDDGWYLLVGTSAGGAGQVLLHRSPDLRSWEYLHPFVPSHSDGVCDDTGHIWECPSFFELDGEHVLIVSRWQGSALTYPNALIGRYVGQRFHPVRRERLDWGYRCFYAPSSLLDAKGRRLMWGWLQEQRQVERANAGWSGAMSLPRELGLTDGLVRQRFVPELAALRGEGMRIDGVEVAGERALELGGPALELRLTLVRGTSGVSGLRLRHSDDEVTDLLVAWAERRLMVDTRRAKGPHPGDYAVDTVPLRGDGGASVGGGDGTGRGIGASGRGGDVLRRVDLHLYLDHSVLELIVDGRHALTTRVYPSGPAVDSVELVARGGTASVERLEGWRMGSIW